MAENILLVEVFEEVDDVAEVGLEVACIGRHSNNGNVGSKVVVFSIGDIGNGDIELFPHGILNAANNITFFFNSFGVSN